MDGEDVALGAGDEGGLLVVEDEERGGIAGAIDFAGGFGESLLFR